MTLQQIDDALSAWNNRLAAVADNLLSLQADPTYQLLTGSGGMVKMPLTGATAARVEPALGAMRTIFEHFGLLHHTIDRAVKLRANLPTLFGAEQRLTEIAQLLFGKSVQMPAVDVPLEQRSLLSGVKGADCLTPDQLLQPMTRSFAAARDAVLAVCEAWNNLAAQIDRAEAQIRACEAEAATAGIASTIALRDAKLLLDQLRAKVKTDPLSAVAELNVHIQPLLDRVHRQVAAADEMRRKLERARKQMDELTQIHAQAIAAASDARARIAGCDSIAAPAADEKPAALRAWLDRLETHRSGGATEAIAVGLRNWQAAADACLAQERAALAANRAPLEARGELRGRLDALKAKARGYGVAEHAALADLAREAETLLYTRPTDLKRAAEAVGAYERSLRGGTERS